MYCFKSVVETRKQCCIVMSKNKNSPHLIKNSAVHVMQKLAESGPQLHVSM